MDKLVLDKWGFMAYIIPMKGNIFYHQLGRSWAVGIETSNPEEVKSQDYSWYNHGAYNGKLHFLSERFAYIWTSEAKMKKYFYNSSLAFYLNKYDDNEKKAERAARLLARLRFNNMTSETFIPHSNCGTYSLATTTQSGSRGMDKNTGGYNDEEEWKQTAPRYYMNA